MRRLMLMFLGIAPVAFAVPVYAQQPNTPQATTNWVAIGAGLAMAIASAVCALAQARVAAAVAEGLARNPAARPGIQLALFLGLALIESLALYTLVIIVYFKVAG